MDYIKGSYLELSDIMLQEYEEADYIVLLSEVSKKTFIERGYPSERLVVTPLGSNFVPEVVPRNIYNTFRLLCVGTDFYWKGIVYLLKAWKELRLKNSELVIIAPVPKTIVNQFKSDNIRFLRHLNHKILRNEYRRATVFCLPSIEDGFGMVVLEAMAF